MPEQLQLLYSSFSRKQLTLIVCVALAVVAGLVLFLQNNRDKDYRPLFTGLSVEDASHVVTKLKEANIDYRVAESGSIVMVRSARLAETRLLVAASGLPKTGRIGFELFDKTNFGATDFAEQINYRRALEGELERSVMSISEVEHARIHLTFPKDSVFVEQKQPAKASVLLKLRANGTLSPKNVMAIEHLVASAVEGLKPEAVTVVDDQGTLLNKPPGSPDEQNRATTLEYKQKVERDLVAKIEATLAPVLGAEHFRAGVTAEVDFSKGEQSEETWDPARSVMVSQQRSEETTGATQASGVPGTPSNLPRPMSRPGSKDQGFLRRTENTTFQSSRLVRRTTIPEGNVRRLAVSTVVDHNVRWEGVGDKAKRVVEPPSDETLKNVQELIAAAIGFNKERGDQIVVKSLPFASTLLIPPAVSPAIKPQPPPLTGIEKWLADKNIKINPMTLMAVAGGLLVLLLGVVAFLVLKTKKKRVIVGPASDRELDPADARAGTKVPAGTAQPALATARVGSSDQGRSLSDVSADYETERKRLETDVLNSIKLPELTTKKAEVLIRHITDQSKRDPVASANLLRVWLAEKEGF